MSPCSWTLGERGLWRLPISPSCCALLSSHDCAEVQVLPLLSLKHVPSSSSVTRAVPMEMVIPSWHLNPCCELLGCRPLFVELAQPHGTQLLWIPFISLIPADILWLVFVEAEAAVPCLAPSPSAASLQQPCHMWPWCLTYPKPCVCCGLMAPGPALMNVECYLHYAQWCFSLPWALWPRSWQVAELAELTPGSSHPPCDHILKLRSYGGQDAPWPMEPGSLLHFCPPFQLLLGSDCSDFLLLVKEHKFF